MVLLRGRGGVMVFFSSTLLRVNVVKEPRTASECLARAVPRASEGLRGSWEGASHSRGRSSRGMGWGKVARAGQVAKRDVDSFIQRG